MQELIRTRSRLVVSVDQLRKQRCEAIAPKVTPIRDGRAGRNQRTGQIDGGVVNVVLRVAKRSQHVGTLGQRHRDLQSLERRVARHTIVATENAPKRRRRRHHPEARMGRTQHLALVRRQLGVGVQDELGLTRFQRTLHQVEQFRRPDQCLDFIRQSGKFFNAIGLQAEVCSASHSTNARDTTALASPFQTKVGPFPP